MTAAPGLPVAKLRELLRDLRQGDLLPLGGIALIGRGRSAATEAATAAVVDDDELWSITVDSAVGWYVIVSSDCDIVRSPEVEPCVVISPVQLVSRERYQQLRSGVYSPREFPLPAERLRRVCKPGDDFDPVVDLRYVSSLDKTALLHPDVSPLRPLSAPQRQALREWVGNRFARSAFSEDLEDNVLGRLGRVLESLAGEYARIPPAKRSPASRLVGAAREWRIGPGGKLVAITPIINEASCREAGLYDAQQREISTSAVTGAAKRLAAALRGVLPPDGGYALKVEPATLDGLLASEYLESSRWTWADGPDPLNED